jgi:hypothetical protein
MAIHSHNLQQSQWGKDDPHQVLQLFPGMGISIDL